MSTWADRSGGGWLADLRRALTGPFNELLLRIGNRARTADRRTIAASFALRYGWASAMAIAPYLKYGCVLRKSVSFATERG